MYEWEIIGIKNPLITNGFRKMDSMDKDYDCHPKGWDTHSSSGKRQQAIMACLHAVLRREWRRRIEGVTFLCLASSIVRGASPGGESSPGGGAGGPGEGGSGGGDSPFLHPCNQPTNTRQTNHNQTIRFYLRHVSLCIPYKLLGRQLSPLCYLLTQQPLLYCREMIHLQ